MPRFGFGGQPLPTNLRSLGDRMRWAREHKQMTQAEVAKAAGTSRDVVAKAELDRTAQPRHIKEIARALDVPASWLLFGQEWSEDIMRHMAMLHDADPEVRDNLLYLIREMCRGGPRKGGNGNGGR